MGKAKAKTTPQKRKAEDGEGGNEGGGDPTPKGKNKMQLMKECNAIKARYLSATGKISMYEKKFKSKGCAWASDDAKENLISVGAALEKSQEGDNFYEFYVTHDERDTKAAFSDWATRLEVWAKQTKDPLEACEKELRRFQGHETASMMD